MSAKSILWTALATAVMATLGCQSTLSPDPHQATPAAAPAPATASAPATVTPRPPRGEEGEGRPAATAPATPRGRGNTPTVPAGLEAAMGEMNRMLTAIKREAVDPAQAEQALKDLATFERDVSICKLLVPPQINRMADAKAKADALTSYRSMLSGLVKTALDLEDAVNDKKPDDAKKLIAQLEEIEKQGHAELNVRGD